MSRKKTKTPQKEGKEREARFDEWAKTNWSKFIIAGMEWKKPHAGFPDRMLYNNAEIICVEVKGVGQKFHPWQFERMQLLEQLGAKVYIATEKEDGSGEFRLHTIHEYQARKNRVRGKKEN